jgi:endonuclease/exonuclease/phosphatase (EEP) superfamily protein YafD
LAVERVRKLLAEGAAAFLTINTAACAAASLLALGGAFSAALDVLSHFALIYIAATVVAAALAAIFLRNWGRPVVLALAAVTLVATGVLVAPEYLRQPDRKAAPDAPGQIKIIQINALRTNRDIRPIVDWLIAQHPDFVTVTEARHDLRDLLVKRTGWRVSGAKGDLMIFSREPRITMARPVPPKGAKLAFVNATYPSASGPFELVTAHLDWPTSPLHARQQADLSNIIARLPRDRMILTGDFNAAPWSFAQRRLEQRLGLIRRDSALPTFPAVRRGFNWPWPVLPIDHIYAGPGWATVSVTRGPRLSSDHYPLVVVLAPAR